MIMVMQSNINVFAIIIVVMQMAAHATIKRSSAERMGDRRGREKQKREREKREKKRKKNRANKHARSRDSRGVSKKNNGGYLR